MANVDTVLLMNGFDADDADWAMQILVELDSSNHIGFRSIIDLGQM